MRRLFFCVLVVCISVAVIGCAKKEAAVGEGQEPMSMESLGTMNATAVATPEMKPAVTPTAEETKLEPLPPPGPYKPTATEIQAALKNAGYYTGAVDGKIGPLSRKAIEDFQKANGLAADGKVGSKTWAVLSPYLNPAPTPATTEKTTKKR